MALFNLIFFSGNTFFFILEVFLLFQNVFYARNAFFLLEMLFYARKKVFMPKMLFYAGKRYSLLIDRFSLFQKCILDNLETLFEWLFEYRIKF